jgi:hypothetical protein
VRRLAIRRLLRRLAVGRLIERRLRHLCPLSVDALDSASPNCTAQGLIVAVLEETGPEGGQSPDLGLVTVLPSLMAIDAMTLSPPVAFAA